MKRRPHLLIPNRSVHSMYVNEQKMIEGKSFVLFLYMNNDRKGKISFMKNRHSIDKILDIQLDLFNEQSGSPDLGEWLYE